MACCRAATSATTLRRGATGRETAVTEWTKKYDYYGFIREIIEVLKIRPGLRPLLQRESAMRGEDHLRRRLLRSGGEPAQISLIFKTGKNTN